MLTEDGSLSNAETEGEEVSNKHKGRRNKPMSAQPRLRNKAVEGNMRNIEQQHSNQTTISQPMNPYVIDGSQFNRQKDESQDAMQIS